MLLPDQFSRPEEELRPESAEGGQVCAEVRPDISKKISVRLKKGRVLQALVTSIAHRTRSGVLIPLSRCNMQKKKPEHKFRLFFKFVAVRGGLIRFAHPAGSVADSAVR